MQPNLVTMRLIFHAGILLLRYVILLMIRLV